MGALIIVGDGAEVLSISSGGFLLDAPFSPQRLSELAKMDGAIILAADASLGLAPRYVRHLAYGDYEAVVEVDGLEPVPPPSPLAVTMTASLAQDAVAAYWPTGQRIDGEVELANDGGRSLDLTVDASTSHHGWQVLFDPPEVTLAAGAGGYERAYITLTRGIRVGANGQTPETVADRFDAISDRAAELLPDGAFAQSAVALGQL